MFFVIELWKGKGTDFAAWKEFERHPALWTARSRVRVMLREEPELKGQIRVVRCDTMDGVNQEFR